MVAFVIVPVMAMVFAPGAIVGKVPPMLAFLFSVGSLKAFMLSQSMLM